MTSRCAAAKIAFFILPNTGGMNASLKLAGDLKARGHDVFYLGLEDSEDYIASNQFRFVPVFRRYFPKGFFEEERKFQILPVGFRYFQQQWHRLVYFKKFIDDLLAGGDEEFLSLLKDLRPDLMIFASGDPYIEWPAMTVYSLGIRSVYFYSTLWPREGMGIPPMETGIIPKDSWWSKLRIYIAWKKYRFIDPLYEIGFSRFSKRLAAKYGYHPEFYDATHRRQMILRLPEIISLPAMFDFFQVEIPGRYHIEASICLDRKQPSFPWNQLDDHRPLIYCALGTYILFGKEKYRQFFNTVIEASSMRPDWQWVIAIGDILRPEELRQIPSNVVVVNNAPQLELLKRARIMITHGGANSVKECIYFGVPMLVFPLGGDTPGYAARIVYHGLGIQGDMCKFGVKYLQDMIESLDRSSYIRSQMKIMQEKFRQMEEAKLGAKLVESILKVSVGE